MIEYVHTPVLLKEVVELLNPQSGQNFVDATLGGGGYTKAILDRIMPDGKVLAIDLDKDAIKNFQFLISNFQKNSKFQNLKTNSVIVHQGNFAQIDKIVERHKFSNINGIVADLGLSTYELDQSGRGFSFQKNELLDMRFDQSQKVDAKFILNNFDQKQLEKIFREYGEEKFSRQIAKKIQESRTKNQIRYTIELYQIIQDALPKPVKHKAGDSARRIFQALRIAVNHELSNLEEFLPKAFDLLNPGGRLVVVTFHSLEDRIVKQFFVKLSKGCVCPPEFPICLCGKNPRARLLNKKPVVPGSEESNINPRAKSAKLRAIKKL
jgi:16S rRNA (cytosine1402-N4)-methyltransferase